MKFYPVGTKVTYTGALGDTNETFTIAHVDEGDHDIPYFLKHTNKNYTRWARHKNIKPTSNIRRR